MCVCMFLCICMCVFVCEKPDSLSVDDENKIVFLCQRSKLKIFVMCKV